MDRTDDASMDAVTAKLVNLMATVVIQIEGGIPAAQIAKEFPDDLLVALELLNRSLPRKMDKRHAAERVYLAAGAPYYDETMRLIAAIEQEMLRRHLKPVDEIVFTAGDGSVIGGFVNPRKPNRS